jgi:tetratricopeptide (TPR) repeat protein
MVELLNRDLPADELLVLYTHSFKILSVLERRRKDDPDLLRKSGISLVQPPEVALVQELLRPQGEDDAPALPVSELTIDLERSKSMSDLRKRLQDDCLPFLEREEMPKADVESLVRSLEGELAELADKTQDWQSLERVAIETSRDEDSGIFQQFRAAIEGFDRDNLRRVLKRNLSELIDEMEELQQRISVGFLPKPEASLTFEHIAPAPSFGMRAILHSKPGSTVYSFRFRSAKIRRYLDRIQDHLERLDQARGSDEQAERFGLQLQQEMYQCEVELKGDPEFYLLLASVYSSRERWFQAYDAASQGLKRLWPQGEVEDSRDPGRERAVTTCELLLAKASALRNWTLREYSDLGLVAAGLLEEAATICRLCLSQQQQWGDLVGVGPEAEAFRDPRCLREIGLIYGTAREDRIPVHPQSEDFQAAGCVAPQDHDDLLLALAICYSRRAYELAREDERMRIFYQNSLIYLLVEEDRDEDLDERLKLVSEFDSPAIETDPNFLDTLAWHHLALARRHKKQGEAFEEDFAEAWRFIDQARALVDRGHRYYHRLIDRHYKEIVAGP